MKALAFGCVVIAALLVVSAAHLAEDASRRDPTDDRVEPGIHAAAKVMYAFTALLLALSLWFMTR